MKLKYQLRGLGIGMIVTSILMGVATGHGIPLTDAEIKARALELGMVEGGSLKLSDVGGMPTPAPQEDEALDPGAEEPEGMEGNGDSGEPDIQDKDQEGSGSDSPDEGSVQPGTEGTGEPEQGGGHQEGSGSGAAGEQEQGGGRQEDSGSGAAGEQEQGGGHQEGSGSGAAGEPGQEGAGTHVVRDGDMIAIVIEPGTDSYAISKTLAEAGLVADAGEFDRFLCNNLYSRKIVDGTYEIPAGAGEEEIAKIITRDR